MAGFSSTILNIATGALQAQQVLIGTTAQNVANANTKGYARRVVNLEANTTGDRGARISIGSGVSVASITRQVDAFKDKLVREASGEKLSTAAKNDYLSRIENLFKLDGTSPTIGSSLTAFFGALNDLTQNPASIELRNTTLQKADELVNSISTTYNTLARLQSEIDTRLGVEIDSINSLTAQIADYNFRVAQIEGGNGRVASDERDRRDQLEAQLAEKLSFDVIELPDGQHNLTLSNGFNLVVSSSSNNLSLDRSPSFATGALPPRLDNGLLNYIVYDYGDSSSSAEINLTDVIGSGDGVLAGLLSVRGISQTTDSSAFDAVGVLPELASRIEGLTRSLLTSFNLEYLGGDEDSGTAGLQPSSADLNGNTPAVYGFFDFSFSGTKDANGDGSPNDLAALGIDNYSSILQLAISQPQEIAAARDQDSTAGSTSFFPGDGSNIEALIGLQGQTYSFNVGNFSQSTTWDDLYTQTVSYVGNQKEIADRNSRLADDKYNLALNQRDSESAVSLDEEFAKLIRYQQGLQAQTKMVVAAREILELIVNLIS